MDTYEWQKNRAIVDRLYYCERLWENTFLAAGMFTATNMLYIKQGYFANKMRARIAPTWMYVIGFNTVISFILLKPLRPDELKTQIRKRLAMGKWLQGTFHLDEDVKYAGTRIF